MNFLDINSFMNETRNNFGIQEVNDSEANQLVNLNEINEINDNIYEHFEIQEVEMIHDIQDVVEADERFKIDNWQELDLSERTSALQDMEIKIAQIEDRAPYRVIVDSTPGCYGYTRFEDRLIALNTSDVMSNKMSDLREVTDTIIHEGRHAYQYHNVYECRTEANEAKFQGWVNNFRTGYLSAEKNGMPAYLSQPLEADAWEFAGKTVEGISFR